MRAEIKTWQPSEDSVARAEITRYMAWLRSHRGLDFRGYDELWRWSTGDLEAFWRSIWDYFDIAADGSREPVLERETMPGARWFPNARVNFAEHLLRPGDEDAVAVLHASELRELSELTRGELRRSVAAAADGLRSLGVRKGDRVAAYMPNISEALIAFLATASLGAVWSSCSPDFGSGSVVDRFAQIEPKILLAVDGYRYGGRDFDRLDVVAQLREAMPSLEHTVLLDYLGSSPPSARADYISWDDLLDRGKGAALRFERVAFDDALWVLYSSGTTGLPKAIVQGHGGILIEQLKSLFLHFDGGPDERLFWFTTTGWMMWNLLISFLLTGGAIVLFDGNPGHPDMGTLWDLADRSGATTFGTSAAFIAACMKGGVNPRDRRDLARLRAVGSTGSPLASEAFDWVAEFLGDDIWLFSTSGGTDLCTPLVGGVPTLPVYRGELQARMLGAAVEAWDEHGDPVVDQVGELIVTRPMPSMPVELWGDSTGERYLSSYFELFPGVWRHGDWIEITSRGTAVIYGRSDSTINRAGIRMGTAEIYRAVLTVDAVLDAVVVDLPKEGTNGWMPLFVVLREGRTLDDDLRSEIVRAIRDRCSPRHVPDEIRQVAGVPRTLSGKVLEVPVKRILMGEDLSKVVSRDSLANPDALAYFSQLAEQLTEPEPE
jgi:acetoacetyl-CoA synthetase